MAYSYLIPKSNHFKFNLRITHVQNYFLIILIIILQPTRELYHILIEMLPIPHTSQFPLNNIGLLMFGIFGNFRWYNLYVYNLYHGGMAAQSRGNCTSDRSLPSVYMYETVMSSRGPEYSRYFYWFKFILRCRDI